MLNLYSIFVYYVLFYQKKLPTSQKTPHHFPAEVGSTPHTPPVWNRAWSYFRITISKSGSSFILIDRDQSLVMLVVRGRA